MLVGGIRDLMNGGAPMSPEIAAMVLKAFHQPVKDEYNLTKREIEILESLTNGNSYKMIASECFISTDTVRRHLQNIYLKLQVQSAPEAVAKALRERLVK
jgi:DNA-binding NarL/FixJ family response regulator